jgi:hypothetical protein
MSERIVVVRVKTAQFLVHGNVRPEYIEERIKSLYGTQQNGEPHQYYLIDTDDGYSTEEQGEPVIVNAQS